MVKHNQQSGNECHSVKYIWDPQKGVPIQLSDPAHGGNAPAASHISNTCVDKTDSNPNQVLTTGQLVHAIGQIWSYAKHPASDQRCFPNSEVGFASSQSNSSIGLESECDKGRDYTVDHPHQKLHCKPDVSAFYGIDVDHGSSSPIGNGVVTATEGSEERILSGVQISKDLRDVYKWMNHSYPLANNMSQHHHTLMQLNSILTDFSVHKDSKNRLSSNADIEKTFVTGSVTSSRTSDGKPAMINQNSFSSSRSSGAGTSFHKADCLVQAINAIEQDAHFSRDTSSVNINEKLKERQVDQGDEINLGLDDMETDISTAACSKPQISSVKQQHAVAGAMAGICVSLCLHPVDTVKTVVQSCHLHQKSILDIGRSIVSERGLSGLYRGISSNIASSAPVSAVYTLTYESVKGVLLPLFPKEYCSVAHCTAGGCASVATSFIFTPSECIKQQMQVRSKYQNCWYALVEIIQKGGLASLYAGWGAVLCRNVPHSIIKFYMYENLKRGMMSSLQCSELDSLQTLACGAVAGSTAALFSTPFDVVKTRLQTQIPGSEHQYRGVFQAIQAIRKSEGFNGLYRGLAPRLLMYMTQGGLFFASYEFFKRTLGLGAFQHID